MRRLLVIGIVKRIPVMRTWVLRMFLPARVVDRNRDTGLAAWLGRNPRLLWGEAREWWRSR